jgi:hypothetical protein
MEVNPGTEQRFSVSKSVRIQSLGGKYTLTWKVSDAKFRNDSLIANLSATPTLFSMKRGI